MLRGEFIKIFKEITFFLSKNAIIIEGPLGINYFLLARAKILNEFNFVLVNLNFLFTKNNLNSCIITNKLTQIKYQKTLIAVLKQKILGVIEGHFMLLEVIGVGYRLAINKKNLIFKLGYSHNLSIEVPCNISCFSNKPAFLHLYSVDLLYLTQFAAKIRKFKQTDIYSGKGLRYQNQVINLRLGKK
jgi:large subunit ribosomal protein L6